MLKKSQESLVTFFETTSNFVVHANLKLKEVKISVPKSQCCKDSSPIFEDSGLVLGLVHQELGLELGHVDFFCWNSDSDSDL